MTSLGFTQGDISSLIADVLGTSKSSTTTDTTTNTNTGVETTPGLEKSAESTPTPVSTRGTSAAPIEDVPAPVPVPSYVMFGRAEGELEHLISQAALQKLPKKPLAKLASHGKYQGVILMMENYSDCQSMLRLKDFLETGRYRPFKPKTALEYIDANGATKPWSEGKDTRFAVKVTNTTKELFLAEIDLYKFAIRIGYDDLRRKSASCLRQDYPVSVDCIWHLLTKVYRTATNSGDAAFAKHIISLVSNNSAKLTEIQAYVREMRQHIKVDSELGTAMVESYISASEAARRKLIDLSKRSDPVQRREGTKDAVAVKEAGPAAVSPTIKRENMSPTDGPALRSLQPNGLRFADLERLARSIYDGNLAVAVEDGYGTLVHLDFPPRNRDFVFSKGELLMVNDLESSTNGRNNIMVYNRRGQRGDILRKLVRRVPSNLGVEGRKSPCMLPFCPHG